MAYKKPRNKFVDPKDITYVHMSMYTYSLV